jgi:hypothetical protein
MALFVTPVYIFLIRTIDRLGKGLRTGARDAVLSDDATPETKIEFLAFIAQWTPSVLLLVW